MAEPAQACCECPAPPVWFINGKAYCEAHADSRYEIQSEPFDA